MKTVVLQDFLFHSNVGSLLEGFLLLFWFFVDFFSLGGRGGDILCENLKFGQEVFKDSRVVDKVKKIFIGNYVFLIHKTTDHNVEKVQVCWVFDNVCNIERKFLFFLNLQVGTVEL